MTHFRDSVLQDPQSDAKLIKTKDQRLISRHDPLRQTASTAP